MAASEQDWKQFLNSARTDTLRRRELDRVINLDAHITGRRSADDYLKSSGNEGMVSTATKAGTKSNEYGGDWLGGNNNYSFDNMKTMARDLAQQQLETQDKLMGLSYGYRTKEKDLDSTIRQREADQKFGFEKNLQELSNTQQLKIQGNQFGQEQAMFDKGTTADTQKTESARRAASSLFYGRRSY